MPEDTAGGCADDVLLPEDETGAELARRALHPRLDEERRIREHDVGPEGRDAGRQLAADVALVGDPAPDVVLRELAAEIDAVELEPGRVVRLPLDPALAGDE